MENEILEALKNAKGCQFVSVLYLSEVRMRKTANPYFGRVIKVTDKNCQFGFSYENAVNNRLERSGVDGGFVAGSLPYGSWLVENKLILHNGDIQVRFYSAKNCQSESKYIIDGNRFATAEEKVEIESFISGSKSSSKQASAGLSESEQVKPFNVKLGNIIGLKICGKTYFVKSEIPCLAEVK